MSPEEKFKEEIEQSMREQRAYEAELAAKGWPPSLIKASCDSFDYACKLRTGEVIYFQEASDAGDDFVTLRMHDMGYDPPSYGNYPTCQGLPFPCPRGIDVRLSDIVWCVDAPWGS